MELPKEFIGLWKKQYSPRDLAIRRSLKGEALKKYNLLSWSQKVSVIDSMQSKGFFK